MRPVTRTTRTALVAGALLALALVAGAAPALGAAGDLPRLVQAAPANVAGGYFDDHTIGGDNHLAWDAGPAIEPLKVAFTSTVADTGAGPLEVCGYASGTAGWLRAFQVTPAALDAGACPAAAPSRGQVGWFRYVVANHSDTTPPAFDRWHLMDFQRFVLVPLPHSLGGPAGKPATVWDTDWGTCLALGDPMMDCNQDASLAALQVGIAPAQTKITQEGAPDAETIAIPGEARASFPDGKYQIVAISNPYGTLREAGGARGSIACTTVALAGAPNYAPFTAAAVPGPSTCYVPRTLIAALTGPGGRDPLAGETPTNPPCPLLPDTGHCWATAPPAGSPNPQALTNVKTAAVVTATDAVPVPKASSLVRYVRSALRRDFGSHLRARHVSCRQVALTGSTCTVRWRKGSASYGGRIGLRFVTSGRHVRWQYRFVVTKRVAGHARHLNRALRTGGAI
jgi:hypothetical protein